MKKPMLLVVMDGVGFSVTGLGDAVTAQLGDIVTIRNDEYFDKKIEVSGSENSNAEAEQL